MCGPSLVTASAADNVGVIRATFYLNGRQVATDEAGIDGWMCMLDASNYVSGPYTVTAEAEDINGNKASANMGVIIESEAQAPQVTIVSPTDGSPVSDAVSLSGTCTDDTVVAGMLIEVDGMFAAPVSLDGTDWTAELDTTMLASGPHTILAAAFDDYGNRGEVSITASVSYPDTASSIGELRISPEGTFIRISGKVVTAVFADPPRMYIQEPSRCAGIMVQTAQQVQEGDEVNVAGRLSTLDGERAITSASVAVVSRGGLAPPALGIVGRNLGGTGSGIPEASGLCNIGLLVTTWGKVTQVGDGYLYIDDGSNLLDGTLTGEEENIGVRVLCDPTGYAVGDYLIVTGISSCFETPSGDIARRILTRKPEDVGSRESMGVWGCGRKGERPTSNVQPPAVSIQPPASSIKYPVSSIQYLLRPRKLVNLDGNAAGCQILRPVQHIRIVRQEQYLVFLCQRFEQVQRVVQPAPVEGDKWVVKDERQLPIVGEQLAARHTEREIHLVERADAQHGRLDGAPVPAINADLPVRLHADGYIAAGSHPLQMV